MFILYLSLVLLSQGKLIPLQFSQPPSLLNNPCSKRLAINLDNIITVLLLQSNRSENIIASIEALRARGTEFLDIPDIYYRELKRHLPNSKVKVKESLDTLQKLKILIDYDDDGYLLQVGLFQHPISV